MSVRFCDACQGGEAYGKTGCPQPFLLSFSFPGTAFCFLVSVCTARRSRTTERSESVSEEAEEQQSLHVILDALVQHISHPA
ncbi:hypothetical protein C4833_25010 [Salmonella enterica subsp. enterica serovar Typhimurium]|nr:hypothetical protein C4833_25010 [Salmonella enterica subsp. enterica serovar Typhimurium]